MAETDIRTPVGVVVITHRARELLPRCLPPLRESPLSPRILVVNSDSRDGTVEVARELGAEVLVVPRHAFNHGTTRELARRHLGTPVVVMLTPDVRPLPGMLERLVRPILAGEAAVAYARQLPRGGADPIERFGRLFAFPERSEVRGLDDYARCGTAAHYCSNACAAWWQPALDAVGGFPPTLVSEETVTVVRLLERGYRIAYVADALCEHSHPTSLLADFRRQFDVGWTRSRYARELLSRGRDEERGRAYLRGLLRHLRREAPHLLPYALLHTAVRYAGYRLGRMAVHWPVRFCRPFSSQDYFWDSAFAPRLREALA